MRIYFQNIQISPLPYNPTNHQKGIITRRQLATATNINQQTPLYLDKLQATFSHVYVSVKKKSCQCHPRSFKSRYYYPETSKSRQYCFHMLKAITFQLQWCPIKSSSLMSLHNCISKNTKKKFNGNYNHLLFLKLVCR